MNKQPQSDLLPGLFAPVRLPWESIVNSARDGVVCVDESGGCLFLNRAAEAMFGVQRSEVIGKAVEFDGDLAQAFVDASGSPDAPFTRDVSRRKADGDSMPLSITITEATHDRQRIQTAVIRDLSAMKQMEEALMLSRKNQAIGSLASGIAHDFNNILTALLSQLDLALDANQQPEAAREHILHAQNSGRRAAELISRLQMFSRQTETQTKVVDFAELIEQVVLILRRSVDRRIRVRHDPAKRGEWLVKGDASQVIQVVLNLCLNARDAMPEGGEIGIHLKRARRSSPAGGGECRWVQLTVRDSGQGMPPEVIERLFEPYFTTKSLGRGTGLGLSIAQSIVQAQGGWIEAESEEERGSRIHVFLRETEPQSTDHGVLHEFVSRETRALEGREAVLIADDEEMVRLVMKAVLSYRGYRITEATDGEHVLEILRAEQGRFDLVLLDVDMPRLNGWDALKKMRVEYPQVRVILLSGGAVASDTDTALRSGAAAFLAKPFRNEELVQLVRRTLDEARPATGA